MLWALEGRSKKGYKMTVDHSFPNHPLKTTQHQEYVYSYFWGIKSKSILQWSSVLNLSTTIENHSRTEALIGVFFFLLPDHVCQREGQVWGSGQTGQGPLWERDEELHPTQGREEEEVQGPQRTQETPVSNVTDMYTCMYTICTKQVFNSSNKAHISNHQYISPKK